jgi:hypothetical protein
VVVILDPLYASFYYALHNARDQAFVGLAEIVCCVTKRALGVSMRLLHPGQLLYFLGRNVDVDASQEVRDELLRVYRWKLKALLPVGIPHRLAYLAG